MSLNPIRPPLLPQSSSSMSQQPSFMDKWHQRLFTDLSVPSSQQHIIGDLRQDVRSFEEKTTQLLHTENIEFVLLWCKYCPVENLDHRAKLLSERPESELDAVLRDLPPKKPAISLHYNGEHNKLYKAKEIVRRLDEVFPTLSSWDLSWWEPGMAPDQVAQTLNERACVLLNIPFSEVTRWFCGLPSPIMEDRRRALLAIRYELCRRLTTNPTFKTELEQVNSLLEDGIPLVWWPVSTSLFSPDDERPDPSDAFAFLSFGIHDVFLAPNLSPTQRLDCLRYLDKRYRDIIETEDSSFWRQNLPPVDWRTEISDFDKQPLAGACLDASDTNATSSVYKVVEDCQQTPDPSTINTMDQASDVADWQGLLHWRVTEAEDFWKSACDKDKRLIDLYLPCLREDSAQNHSSDSLQHCQWQPPAADQTQKSEQARNVNSHVLDHFGAVPFTEVIKAAFRVKSWEIEKLEACLERIYHLQCEFDYIQDYFEVLSVQYRDAQTPEPPRPWNGEFSSDFTFWDDINFKVPWELAESMTKKHMELFESLCNEDFPRSDRLSSIDEISKFLSNDVRECVLADGSLVTKLADLERVFWQFRNDFAASAVHQGLASAGKDPRQTLIFNKMANTRNNYQLYRQHRHEIPRLTFLPPYTTGRCSQKERQKLFRFPEYAKWRQQGQYDDLAYQYRSDKSSAPERPWPESLPSWVQYVFQCFNFLYHHRAATSQHLDLEKGSHADISVTNFSRNSSEEGARRLSSTIGHQSATNVFRLGPYKGEEGEVKKSLAHKRTCLTGLLSAYSALHKPMQTRTISSSAQVSLKLRVDWQWVSRRLGLLIRPLPAVRSLQSVLPSCLRGPSSNESLYSNSETCLPNIRVVKEDPDLPPPSLRSSPQDDSMQGNINIGRAHQAERELYLGTSMTGDQVLESYTLLHLSNVTEYGKVLLEHLEDQFGSLQNLPGIVELPDETWEVVVHRQYVSEFHAKLSKLFPLCCVNLDYDPMEPSKAEIERFGNYEVAKWQKEAAFIDRAQLMMDAWPKAARYYNIRAEMIGEEEPQDTEGL
ncbi:hypothetical protein OIDMADRAFT_149816 [Oidiodendron maius Zn]|uniref:Uncharacterized protein n=1 Tax=Oidiodendron maius (strain Zn) TaxID=913774 RepID=A0A0C3CTV5_OIDMZ|nr:hypothetical protein OIDMADRAFT_149816 [Oidiodendron maius Zn]